MSIAHVHKAWGTKQQFSTPTEMEHLCSPTDELDMPIYTLPITLVNDSNYTGLYSITYLKHCVLLS